MQSRDTDTGGVLLQVHVEEWRVEVQEGERWQDLVKQQHDAPPDSRVARSASCADSCRST